MALASAFVHQPVNACVLGGRLGALGSGSMCRPPACTLSSYESWEEREQTHPAVQSTAAVAATPNLHMWPPPACAGSETQDSPAVPHCPSELSSRVLGTARVRLDLGLFEEEGEGGTSHRRDPSGRRLCSKVGRAHQRLPSLFVSALVTTALGAWTERACHTWRGGWPRRNGPLLRPFHWLAVRTMVTCLSSP